MNRLVDWPLRRKLFALSITTCLVVIVVVVLLDLGLEWQRARENRTGDLAHLAEHFNDPRLDRALAEENPAEVVRMLKEVVEQGNLVYACFYQPDGTVVGEYRAPAGDTMTAPSPAPAGSRFVNGQLQVFADVVLADRVLGRICLVDKTARLLGAIYQQAAWHGLFLAVALVVVLGLVTRWQRSLLQPLAELTGLTEQIGATKDLNLRASTDSNDELGQLARSFNAMIEQVQQQQHELQQQGALLQTTLDSLGEGVIAADNSGKMTLFNHKAREILGQGISDKLPESWPEEYGVIDAQTGKPMPHDELPLVRALAGQTVAEHELCLRSPTANQDLWLSVTATPVRDASTKTSNGGVVVFRDITEERAADRKYRELNERFSGLFRASKDAIGFATLDGRVPMISPSYTRIFGYTATDFDRGLTFYQITPPEYHEMEKTELARVMRDGVTVEYEKEVLHKDGRRIPVHLTVFLVPGDEGEPIGLAAIIRDITEERQAAAALRESEVRWRSLLTHSHDFLIIVDRQGTVLSLNRVRPGETAEQIVGRSVFDLLPVAAEGNARRLLDQVFTNRQAVREEMLAPAPDDTPRWYDVQLVPIIPDQVVDTVLVMARDVTRRKHLERQLIEVSEEEQARLGRELHDGLCQTLVSASLTSRLAQQLLQTASNGAANEKLDQLTQILEDSLAEARELSRLLNPLDPDPQALEHAIHALAARVTQSAGIRCTVDLPSPWVFRSENPLVVNNLFRIIQEAVNNAVRHSGATQVHIVATGGRSSLTLSVTDNGCGLLPADQRSAGMGIRSMQYRTALLNGELELAGAEGGGTMVRFRFGPPATTTLARNAHGKA